MTTCPDTHRDFLLASMRVASFNLRSWSAEIDMISVALRGGLIDLEIACEHLDDMGILRWLPPDQGAES